MPDQPRLAYDRRHKVYYAPDPELAKAARKRKEFWDMVANSICVGAAICWFVFACFSAIVLGVGMFVEFIPKYGLRGLYAIPVIIGLVSSVVLMFQIAAKRDWI